MYHNTNTSTHTVSKEVEDGSVKAEIESEDRKLDLCSEDSEDDILKAKRERLERAAELLKSSKTDKGKVAGKLVSKDDGEG